MEPVVRYTIEGNIALVSMSDRASSNTFTHALTSGLMDTFNALESNEHVKVVVIHGFDNYFCCGGTQEELLKFQAGTMSFADLSFYRLLLDCRIPTIAAMQGHAVGGGLVFGCYADLMILAEECVYSANFMKYGFTPGMGATYIVPKKFGDVIGNELLYTAETYLGSTLRQRNVRIPVVKKSEVIPRAMELAKQIADKPRHSLQLLKATLTHTIHQKLPDVINNELVMHEKTFVLPEVRVRIEERFGR